MCISMYEIDVSSPDKLKKKQPSCLSCIKKERELRVKKNPFKL